MTTCMRHMLCCRKESRHKETETEEEQQGKEEKEKERGPQL